MTDDMLNVQWLQMGFYPAGYFTRQHPDRASVKLPEGWGSPPRWRRRQDQRPGHHLQDHHLRDPGRLADVRRPLLQAGRPGPDWPGPPVRLNMVADRPEQLEIKPEQLQIHKDLVQQAYKLYGAHHYDHYDFLVALSDQLGGIGLEHHRSSENASRPSTSPTGTRPSSAATCWPTNTPTRGTASSAAAPTCGPHAEQPDARQPDVGL
jgi:predicted metalloprotease with PDZ domain